MLPMLLDHHDFAPCGRRFQNRRSLMPTLPYFTDEKSRVRDLVFDKCFNPHQEPRTFQEEALLASVRRKNTLVVAPTNAGKSKIISLLATWFMEGDPEAMVLFIGPLVSLQHQLARTMGSHLIVMTWDSKCDKNAQQLAMKRGKYRVMGVAPEMFEMPWFLTILRSEYWREHLAFGIVDEVHTVVD
jgi:superfamily II DNA helicase RecQ